MVDSTTSLVYFFPRKKISTFGLNFFKTPATGKVKITSPILSVRLIIILLIEVTTFLMFCLICLAALALHI